MAAARQKEMNDNMTVVATTTLTVAGRCPEAKKTGEAEKPSIVIPTSAVRDGAVFVVSNGRAVRRSVKAGSTGPQGVRIDEGLIGGEDLIVSPPADLKDGDRVKPK